MDGSFEHIARWWNEKAGDAGDFYHRHVILPALLATLGEVAGRPVLDLGCANGVLSRLLARHGAQVTGVDISPSLIGYACERETAHPLGIRYLVGDAAHLPTLPDAGFSHVTANMVLMDIEDAAGMFGEVGRLLESGGRFVASLLHPCFEAPGSSDWQEDEGSPDRPLARRIWGYREPYTFHERISNDQPETLQRFHRPLSWYAARLRDAGLLIDTLDEPLPDQEYAEQKPKSYRRQQQIPTFLIIGARKVA